MPHREQVLQQALQLSPEDRAYIADALEDSLAPVGPRPQSAANESDEAENVAGAELLAELDRRFSAYRAGKTTARTADEVLADLKRRQNDEVQS